MAIDASPVVEPAPGPQAGSCRIRRNLVSVSGNLERILKEINAIITTHTRASIKTELETSPGVAGDDADLTTWYEAAQTFLEAAPLSKTIEDIKTT